MPLPPLLLAEIDASTGFVSSFTALVALGAAAALWLALRRRHARASLAALLMGGLLAAGSFLPPPQIAYHDQVSGHLTGQARIPVAASPEAPLRLDRGEGRLEAGPKGMVLVLDCPERCLFALGADPAWGAGAGARVGPGEDLIVELEGGPLLVRGVNAYCQRLPVVLMLLRGGHPCAPCWEAEYLTGAGQSGRVTIERPPVAIC